MNTPPDMVYLPDLAEGRLVRYYHFRHPQFGPSSCVLVSDCKANSPNLQYAHVLYVYEGGDFIMGRPCFAVASEVNQGPAVSIGRSHFLGLFPGDGQQIHINLGASDDWADIQKFTPRALELIVEHFSLANPPQEVMVPTVMLQRFRVPHSYVLAPSTPPLPPPPAKKWWEFWKS